MEVKDLMVDDWVQVTDLSSDIENKIGRVISIDLHEGNAYPQSFTIAFKDDEHENCHYVRCRKCNVHPIPLTREILEKNGFNNWIEHSLTTRSCSILLDVNTNIIVQTTDGDDSVFTQIYHFGAGSYEIRISIKYVHQLQHLLYLCGIKMEIAIV